MIAEPDRASEHLREYLRQLTPQVRSRLLRIGAAHLLEQDIPQFEALMAALCVEFRNAGQSHYCRGNASRYFFEPLEPVLVNEAPELARSGQITRGSLTPIWNLVTEKSPPRMANDYMANAKKSHPRRQAS